MPPFDPTGYCLENASFEPTGQDAGLGSKLQTGLHIAEKSQQATLATSTVVTYVEPEALQDCPIGQDSEVFGVKHVLPTGQGGGVNVAFTHLIPSWYFNILSAPPT